MKHGLRIRLVVTLVGLACLAFKASASESNKNIVCDARFIEAPREEINKLFTSSTYQVSEEQLQKLNELIKTKKAKILAQPRICTVSGNQVQIRSVLEKIYPSEYTQPSGGGAGTQPSSETTSQGTGSNITVNVTVNNSHPSGGEKAENIPVIPDAFKTRESGAFLNMTPTIIGNGPEISCSMIPEFVIFAGYDKYDSVPSNITMKALQPIFYSYNLTTSITLTSGTTVLLGVHDIQHHHDQDNVIVVLFSAAIAK